MKKGQGRMGGKRRGCIREELKKQLENRLQDPIFTQQDSTRREERKQRTHQ